MRMAIGVAIGLAIGIVLGFFAVSYWNDTGKSRRVERSDKIRTVRLQQNRPTSLAGDYVASYGVYR
jgi:hypothetical protein